MSRLQDEAQPLGVAAQQRALQGQRSERHTRLYRVHVQQHRLLAQLACMHILPVALAMAVSMRRTVRMTSTSTSRAGMQ